MADFKALYDEREDILYLSKEGIEEVVELFPRINAELDMEGNLIGVEIFNASNLLKDVVKLIENKFDYISEIK